MALTVDEIIEVLAQEISEMSGENREYIDAEDFREALEKADKGNK